MNIKMTINSTSTTESKKQKQKTETNTGRLPDRGDKEIWPK